jgi:uncharacterized phage infection (PIP) family protein YhgE
MTFEKLKAKVEALQRRADRAKGALEAAERRLKEEFGCSTTEEAKALLKDMDSKLETAQEKYNEELKAFEKEWGDVLGEDQDKD